MMKYINSIRLSNRLFLTYSCLYQKRNNMIINNILTQPKFSYCKEYTASKVNSNNINERESTNVNKEDENWDSKDQNKDDTKAEDELQSKILQTALSFVPQHGWSSEAIAKGAESLGYSSMAHGMMVNGGIDLVNYFYKESNAQLEKELNQLAKSREQGEKISTTQFIRRAIEIRLRMNIPYINTWPQALALHVSPTNISTAVHNIGTLMDTIWHHAGDKSTDFTWYTKRGVLATVYKSTELCMIQDKSEDFKDSWEFLDRRLTEIKKIADCIRQAENTSKDIGSIGQAGLITALNILGLNSKSRKKR